MGRGYSRITQAGSSVSVGFFDYNDAATAVTPINVPIGLVNVDLTNDAAGPFTNVSYPPLAVTKVWDSTTNLFDWSELSLGDVVDIRLDIVITTTTPNQLVEIDLLLGVGAGQYAIPFTRNTYKNAGAQAINRYNGVYMGDANTRDNPAKFVVRSDAAATVVVNGWYCKVVERG